MTAEDGASPSVSGPVSPGSTFTAGTEAAATAKAAPRPTPSNDQAGDGKGGEAAETAEAAADDGTARKDAANGTGGKDRKSGARGGGRGRPPSLLFDLRTELPGHLRWLLATLGLLGVFALWLWAASRPSETVVVPTPGATFTALRELWSDGRLWTDLQASGERIVYGYAISMVLGIVVGVAMGSLLSAEAAFEAPVAFMRYVPAAALTPLMLSWLGIDETPKITLIVLGTVFFNILMVADVARAVPRELIEASYTLGARRWTVLRKIVFRHSAPGIIDVARINLAAGWLMLVVAELLAAKEGLAFRITKAQRFHNYDTMFAILLVFGALGVVSDLALRWLRNVTSPWARP